MAPKNSAEIFVDYPINAVEFIDNRTLLVCGGGGECRSGVPNKITAMRCSFKTTDKKKRLQKFREVILPPKEDCPLAIAAARLPGAGGLDFTVFVGCNQSQELRKIDVNRNVRKYSYLRDHHFAFHDAVQFDPHVRPQIDDPKHLQLAPDASVAVMMTTAMPSEIVVFEPATLECTNRICPDLPFEIVDIHLCAATNGSTLTYITASSVTTVNTAFGDVVHSTSATAAKTLAKYYLSKVRCVSSTKVLLAASLRSRKGAALLEYDLQTGRVTKERLLNKTSRVVVLEYCESRRLVAVALSDCSVALIRAHDFKLLKTYKKLHNFAITSLSFCPNGSKLASGSAAQSVNVLLLEPSPGFLSRIFRVFFWTIFFAVLAFVVQITSQNGALDKPLDLLRVHGGETYVQAQKYGKLTYEFSQHHGAEYYKKAQHHGAEYYKKARHHGAIYLDVAQRYGKIGLTIAKQKGQEGYSLALDKIEQWRTPNETMLECSTSPEWVLSIEELTETPLTTFSETTSDNVSVRTRSVLTEDLHDIDTLSLIGAGIKQVAVTSASAAYISEFVQSMHSGDVSDAEESLPSVTSDASFATSVSSALSQFLYSSMVPEANDAFSTSSIVLLTVLSENVEALSSGSVLSISESFINQALAPETSAATAPMEEETSQLPDGTKSVTETTKKASRKARQQKSSAVNSSERPDSPAAK